MRSTNEYAAKCAVIQAARRRCDQAAGCASRCACTTSLQNVSGVNSRGMSATFMGVLKRSAGISERYDRSCAMPFSVTMPFCSNSASGRSPRAFSTILPRGILILNVRSSRKTMSRKSIDSASSPSISDTSSLTSSTSQPSASAIVSATLGYTAMISSLVTSVCVMNSLRSLFHSLFHLETAIDTEYLTRHIIRVPRGEKPDGVGDFLRLAVALEQDPRLDRVACHVAHGLRHFGLDHTWRNAVDRDLARRQLDRKGAGERIDRALARRVVGLSAAALLARDRREVDDLAGTLNDHMRYRGARDVEYAADVGVQHQRDILVIHRRQLVVAYHPRVVHQDIDPAGTFGDPIDGRRASFAVPHIDLFRSDACSGRF